MIARSYFKKYDLNFQLLQFLMMNKQLAAQALQQPQINPFNQTQAVQLRGNFFTISFFFFLFNCFIQELLLIHVVKITFFK